MRYTVAHDPEHPVAIDAQPDDFELPVGNHPLEVAARRGLGPLSPRAQQVWHGDARPCVSCGQLVDRDAGVCDECGQDLSEEMLEKMRQHAGPWYVLEHLRPFPGVSLERIVKQIRRGLITETSIVRGPATDYQWRFAVETPSLCRYFNRCWNCHHEVAPIDTYCPSCLTHLSFQRFPEPRAPESPAQAGGVPTGAGFANRSQSTAELTKPLEVRPAYVPPRPQVPPIPPASATLTGLPPHLRRDVPKSEAETPFTPRPAASIATAVGIPASSAAPSVDRNRPAALAKSSKAPTVPTSPELARLANAVASFDQVPRDAAEPAFPGRLVWIAAVVVVIAIVVVLAIARS